MDIRRLIRSRDRKHRKTGNPKDKLLFRELKHKVQQQIHTAYHHYVEDILGLTTEPGNNIQSKPDTKKRSVTIRREICPIRAEISTHKHREKLYISYLYD